MTTAQRVEYILKASHKARNSDKELIKIYLYKAGLELTPAQIDKLMSLPSFETITRVRRKLQEQGKYPASEEVNEARYNKFKSITNNMATADAPQAEQILENLGLKFAD